MVAFALSNLTGLLRSVLMARAFGTSAELEAFTAANQVSETLFNLIAGGALGSAFIPTYTTLLSHERTRQAWKLASAVANWVLLVSTTVSVLAAIFAPQIVRYLLASGFADDPYKFELTVRLLRLMLPSAVIFGLSGLVMGILNSHQVFLAPALAPSMYSLGIIAGILVLSPLLGIFGLAAGVLIGSALHLLLQVPALLRQKPFYRFTWGKGVPELREVLRLMGPRLFGVAIVQLNFWVNVNLASFMAEGSVNGVRYAFQLMLMPQALIAQSIAIAALPTFSAQAALGKLDEMRSSLASSLRGVILLSVPAAIGLILLRRPLITFLFQRGEFDVRSTELVVWALLWYAVGLVGHSVVEVMARSFYALHDTRTPVLVGAAAMGLNVAFSFLFASLFGRLGWMPHGGLALANSLATALEMAGLLAIMRRRLQGVEGSQVFKGFLQASAASLVMGLGLWWWLDQSGSLPAWLVLGAGLAIGLVVYGVSILALGGSEVRGLLRRALERVRLKTAG